MKLSNDISATIGNTPLVKLNRVVGEGQATVAVKLEYFNPSGSLKDRAARSMVERAEAEGRLRPGGTLIEATSGNTGYAVAMLAAARGYRSIIICSDKTAAEKVATLKAYGAEVIHSRGDATREDEDHYANMAAKLEAEMDNALYVSQSYNPGNPAAHYQTTGPEIWTQTEGKVSAFVTSAGTGGTVSGAGKYLKEKHAQVEIVLADPVGSVYHQYLTTGEIQGATPYLVEAAGQDELYVPPTFQTEVVDRVIQVEDKEALVMARRLAREEGIFCGMSSGLNVHAAVQLAREMGPEDLVVTIICDMGGKYLSRLYSEDWLDQHFPEGI